MKNSPMGRRNSTGDPADPPLELELHKCNEEAKKEKGDTIILSSVSNSIVPGYWARHSARNPTKMPTSTQRLTGSIGAGIFVSGCPANSP
jgi:hypothetical protein